ncbi:unnamed protein product, partial [Prorocentrum cordatum]
MQIGDKTVQVTKFEKREDRPKPEIINYTNLYSEKCFPDDWNEKKIKEEFAKFGAITSMEVREDGKGRKFAFVNYEETEAAKKAVEELHMKEMRTEEEIAKAKEEDKEEEKGPDGHPLGKLYVQRAQTRAERQAELREKFPSEGGKGDGKAAGVNLYIKNLDENTDDASLRALFEPFGTITSASTPIDDKGKSKGFGFVCFASPDEATKA